MRHESINFTPKPELAETDELATSELAENREKLRAEALNELDDWFFETEKKPDKAATEVCQIVGSAIGIKEVTFLTFLDGTDISPFQSLLNELNLKTVTERRTIPEEHLEDAILPEEHLLDVYIVQNEANAIKAQGLFHRLWQDGGFENPELNSEIGEMLGYPKTAIDYYADLRRQGTDPADFSQDERERCARNRFYIHSPEHEDEEFDAFERKIYEEVNKYCPKTTATLLADTGKRNLPEHENSVPQVDFAPITSDDAELFYQWTQDETNTDFYDPEADLEKIRAKLAKFSPDAPFFKIMVEKQPVGFVSLYHQDQKNRSAMFGITIGSEAQRGQGIGTAAVKKMVQYGFEEMNLHSIYLTVLSYNQRAIRCYEKAGFKQTGRRRDAEFRDGRWHDKIMMDITEDEWRSQA